MGRRTCSWITSFLQEESSIVLKLYSCIACRRRCRCRLCEESPFEGVPRVIYGCPRQPIRGAFLDVENLKIWLTIRDRVEKAAKRRLLLFYLICNRYRNDNLIFARGQDRAGAIIGTANLKLRTTFGVINSRIAAFIIINNLAQPYADSFA